MPQFLRLLFHKYLKTRPKVELSPSTLMALKRHEERVAKGTVKYMTKPGEARGLILGERKSR